MVSFPNCKVNLGLHILNKRADGYHNLETVFYPVNICDALEILPAPQLSEPQLTLSGLPVAGNKDNNLCRKAWSILKKDFPQLPAVFIHLHKAIPMGAGLGGGSADGAFMLLMLNEKFNLQLSHEQLIAYALQLGSDCPFFILNQPSFATGRGELLQSITINLNGYFFYIVNPGIHVNTGEAFAQLVYTQHPLSVQEIISQPVENWKGALVNDFEAGIAKKHPEIVQVKEALYQHGAVYAAMSGSGSTVFGIFKQKPTSLSFPDHYFTRIVAASSSKK